MRIGLDAKRAFNNRSGLGNYSRDVIRSLSKMNEHDLFLYTPKINKEIFSLDDFSNANIELKTPKDALNQSLTPYWRSFSIAKDIQKDKLDLYHGLSNEIPFTLGRMTKTVVTIHDLIFKRYPEWYGRFDRKMYDWKFKSACKNADAIVAISEQTKSDIVSFYKINPDKISVVYQTCNDIFKSPLEADFKETVRRKYALPETFLLNVGTIEPRKNAFNIVKALHLRNLDVPLIIIGRKTKYAEKIEAYIHQHKLEKQIRLLHNVSNEELPAFYQMADLFLYPSTFEGFGIPIIEALYSGTPVISSTGGCFSEAGGTSSLYVEAGNIEALADAIQSVSSDASQKNKMIKEGLNHVQRFDTEKVTKDLLKVYQSLF